jgi:hypothetical protein
MPTQHPVLRSLELKNFRCHRDLRLPDLAPITLIGGENGTGKTVVLEAIFAFLARANTNLFVNLPQWRNVVTSISPDGIWRPLFYDYDYNNRFSITLNSNETLTALVEDAEVIEHTLADGSTAIADEPISDDTILSSGVIPATRLALTLSIPPADSHTAYYLIQSTGDNETTIATRTPFSRDHRNTVLMTSRGTATPTDATRYGKLRQRKRHGKVLDILRLFDQRIEGLSAIPIGQSAQLHVDIGLPNLIPIGDVSDGIARLASLAISMLSEKADLLLVDEIGSGIHYSRLDELWSGLFDLSTEHNCQIIATTHSSEVLRAAINASSTHSTDLAYIRLDRLPNNDTAAECYSRDDLADSISRGIEVR